jgi:hypothetical protein
MIPNWNKILKEWSYRVGVIKPNDDKHLYHLSKILEERGWPYEVITEFVNEIDFKDQDAFDAYNKKHKMRKSTKVTIGDKETTVGDAETGDKKEKDDKPKSKISREDIDSIDGDSKSKALDKKEKAPGNESSVINEVGVGIGMSHLSDNPDMSVDELEDKLFEEIMNTKIGKSNKEKATRNACRAAAKSAKREYTRTQKTIQKNDMNPETTKTSHVWGSKDSLQGTVDYLEKMGVKEVNGILFEEYKKIILEGGAGKNPTDTMIVMVDDSKKPPKAIINHTSNKTSSNDIQGNSGPDKNADYVMNRADEDLENGKITKEEHEQITQEMTRLREDFVNAQNQIEELINEQFERMESDINNSKKRKELLNRVKNLSTGETPAKYWNMIVKRYAKRSDIDLKGKEFDFQSGTYKPPLSKEEEAQILMSYQKEMKDFANQEEEAVEPPKWATEIMARKDMYPPPEQDLNDLYRVQHSLISETRKTVDKIKDGYGTQIASQNMFERLHLDVVQGHNPGGIPTENFEVNMGNNESGRKYDEGGNAYHHTGAGFYRKVNPKTGKLEGDKFKPKQGQLTDGDSAVVVNPTTIAGALGIEPPAKDLTSRIRVSEVKSGKGKSGVATIYGTTVDGEEIIIGYQTIRPKQGPGSKHQDTIQFHKDFQRRLVEQTEKLDD